MKRTRLLISGAIIAITGAALNQGMYENAPAYKAIGFMMTPIGVAGMGIDAGMEIKKAQKATKSWIEEIRETLAKKIEAGEWHKELVGEMAPDYRE